jgi:hypothetical protein
VTLRYLRSPSADENARRGFAGYARDPLPDLSVHGLRLSPGVPLFRASFDDALGGKMLENARFVGWRYFAFDENRAVAADVAHDGRRTFAHVFGGSGVSRTLDAVSYAERLAAEEVEVLLLTIPSVFVTAVWLATATPWLIVVGDKVRKMRSRKFVDFVRSLAVPRKQAYERSTEFERTRNSRRRSRSG